MNYGNKIATDSKLLDNINLGEWLDVVISGVQGFSCFSVSVVDLLGWGKQMPEQITGASPKERAGAMSSLWDISKWRHPGDLEERSG